MRSLRFHAEVVLAEAIHTGSARGLELSTVSGLGVGVRVDPVLPSSDTLGTGVELDPRRFNRHTFWCGQSGSGKTYALGVVLEQLLLETELPILVLDPNSDFVKIDRARPEADPAKTAALAAIPQRVLRSGDGPGDKLRARYAQMDVRSRAAVLRLDPLRDADEYNVHLKLAADVSTTRYDVEELRSTIGSLDGPGGREFLLRLENLGVLEWDLWAWGAECVEDVIDQRPRATVMDLGGFRQAEESKVAALAALDHLWNTRESRRPILIVIDEAHNLCPANPLTPVEVALTDRIVQIAAEGRKFGLWLLLSTQRPSKIHTNALSQCDNLGLMRMSSPRDLAELAEYFGYAPIELLQRASSYALGQALFAGGFIDEAVIAQMGTRLTAEGGSDVKVPL